MNPKAKIIKIDRVTCKETNPNMADVVRGTEEGHYYVPRVTINGIIIGARRLDENASFGEIKDGPNYRVRLVPVTEATSKQVQLIKALGFEDKSGHYSQVTTKADAVITAIAAGLDIV